ncbi:MAG: hypothetical protein ABW044_03145 [Cellvibrio sp.]
MSRLNKLNTFLITLVFAHSASAVIVQDTFGIQTTKEISLEKNNENTGQANRVVAHYKGDNGTSFRTGYLALDTQLPVLNGLDLVQDFSVLPTPNVQDNVVSYIGLESSGIANRADYHGWTVANLSVVEVDADEAVTVPEPSSLLLFFAPVMLLLWRVGLSSKISRES